MKFYILSWISIQSALDATLLHTALHTTMRMRNGDPVAVFCRLPLPIVFVVNGAIAERILGEPALQDRLDAGGFPLLSSDQN